MTAEIKMPNGTINTSVEDAVLDGPHEEIDIQGNGGGLTVFIQQNTPSQLSNDVSKPYVWSLFDKYRCLKRSQGFDTLLECVKDLHDNLSGLLPGTIPFPETHPLDQTTCFIPDES